MELRSIKLPGGGVLAWNDPAWLQYILPTDSWKKRLVRASARFPLIGLVAQHFNGSLSLDGQQFELTQILAELSDVMPDAKVSAIFVNTRRDPPRIYVWLSESNQYYFLKIGSGLDHAAFQNEFEVVDGLEVLGDIMTMRPLALRNFEGLAILLSEGLNIKAHQVKQKLSSSDIISQFAAQGFSPEGFFGGPVHGDLASNNVFVVKDKVLVVDWEFSARKGPDYCDLIELGIAQVIADPRLENTIEAIANLLERDAGFRPSNVVITKALNFLNDRGNQNARQLLSSVALDCGNT